MEITRIEPFLSFCRSVRKRTRAAALAVPANRIEWRPTATAFSAGDLLRHIAGTERWMFVENVLGRPSRYPGHGEQLARGHAAVMAYLDSAHTESLQLLAELPADRMQETCTTVAAAEVPVWLLLRMMLEHEIHHRGQLYSLLGQLGVARPSLFGLTEQEVLDRSTTDGGPGSGQGPPPAQSAN